MTRSMLIGWLAHAAACTQEEVADSDLKVTDTDADVDSDTTNFQVP